MSLDKVLDKCLQDIQAGKATMEECLARYPELADELEPLLRMGQLLMELPAVEPLPEFVAQTRARLLTLKPPAPEAVRRRPAWKPQRWLAGFVAYWRSWQWQRAFVGALAILMVVVLIGGGTVVASAESLPNHPLYSVKRVVESARLFLAASPESKAMLHVEFANRRLSEAMAVAQKGQSEAAKSLIEEYNSELLSALVTLEQAAAGGAPVAEVSFELRGQVAGQQTAVEDARATLPDEAVDSALEVARKVDAALAELATLQPSDRAKPEHPTPTSLPTYTPTATPRPKIVAPVSPPLPTRVPPTQRPEVEAPKATPVIVVLPTRTPETYTEPPRLTPIIVLQATDTPRPPTPVPTDTPTHAPPRPTPTARPATPTNTPVPPTVTPRGPTPTEATPTEVPPTSTPQTPIPRPPTPTLTSQPPAAPTTSSSMADAPMPTSEAQ